METKLKRNPRMLGLLAAASMFGGLGMAPSSPGLSSRPERREFTVKKTPLNRMQRLRRARTKAQRKARRAQRS